MRFPQEVPTTIKVKRILGHVENEDGSVEFLTQREGEDTNSAEYIASNEFLSDSAKEIVKYCKDNGLVEALGMFAQ